MVRSWSSNSQVSCNIANCTIEREFLASSISTFSSQEKFSTLYGQSSKPEITSTKIIGCNVLDLIHNDESTPPNCPDLRPGHYCGGWRQLVITRQLTTLLQDPPEGVNIVIHRWVCHVKSPVSKRNPLVFPSWFHPHSRLWYDLLESLRSLKSAASHWKKHLEEGLVRHCRHCQDLPPSSKNFPRSEIKPTRHHQKPLEASFLG